MTIKILDISDFVPPTAKLKPLEKKRLERLRARMDQLCQRPITKRNHAAVARVATMLERISAS